MKRSHVTLLAVIGSLPFLAGTGCPPATNTPNPNGIFDIFTNPDDPLEVYVRMTVSHEGALWPLTHWTAARTTALVKRMARSVPTRSSLLPITTQMWRSVSFGASRPTSSRSAASLGFIPSNSRSASSSVTGENAATHLTRGSAAAQ